MKKIIYILLSQVLCLPYSFSQNHFGELQYSTPSPMYVGQPVEEIKALNEAIRAKNQREANYKMRNAINTFLDFEESAYKQLDAKKLTKENYEGFLFYSEKAYTAFANLSVLSLDENIIIPSLNDLSKEFSDLYYPTGVCYFMLEDYTKAKEKLNVIKDNNYDAAKLLETITKVEFAKKYAQSSSEKEQAGDLKGALADRETQINILPSGIGYFQRGRLKSLLGDNIGGRVDYYKALELYPDFSMAYNNIAYSFIIDKNYSEGLKNVNKAIELDASNSDAYDTRGEIEFYLNDWAGAITDCSYSISLSANKPIANSYLIRGRAKYKLKDKSGACFDWQTAKQIGDNKADEFLKLCANKN